MKDSKRYDINSLIGSLYQSYSREQLTALLALLGRLYMLLDGHWYLSVKQRLGDEQAIDIDLEVWSKQARKEVEGLAELMGLKNRDVVSLMELSAIMPSSAGSQGYIEVTDRNDCTLVITHCPIFKTLEKEGKGREKTQCDVICRRLMTTMALCFNPGIEVESTLIAALHHQGEVYCRWRFKLGQP